ncbi:MAG: hypothetical protein WAK53_18420 [Chromatiaceae bacterium]|jgi:predicted nucleic acid-binding protein
MFALDTNSLIDFFKRTGAAGRLLATAPAEIVVRTIVLRELELAGFASRSVQEVQRVPDLKVVDWF